MAPLDARNPSTILLGDGSLPICHIPASESIMPGDLIELFSDSGTLKWRKNASATEIQAMFVAMDQPELNLGIDDAYAAGDLVKAKALRVGDVWYARIGSGQDISGAELLKSAGNGMLQTVGTSTAAANLGHFQSLDAPGAVLETTRIRAQRIN